MSTINALRIYLGELSQDLFMTQVKQNPSMHEKYDPLLAANNNAILTCCMFHQVVKITGR